MKGRVPLMRIREVKAPDGLGMWRVISGDGPKLKAYGDFPTREAAVKYVLERLKIGSREAATPPGETYGSTPRPRR